MNDQGRVQGHLRLTHHNFSLDAQFDFPAAGVTAVFGPSGAGKSTLLRIIAGLERQAEGELRVKGETWQSRDYFRPAHKRAIGYVFQEPSLLSHLNVEKNLLFGFRRLAPSARQLHPDEVIPRLGLAELLGRKVNNLSGGERQRVALGRALLTSPELLLLDEPLSALDKPSKAEILPYLKNLREIADTPVIYVSHSHDEVARLADYLILMDGGRISGHGDAAKMINQLDSPLTPDDENFSLLQCVLEAQETGHQLSRLRIGQHTLRVPALTAEVGQRVRVRIQARDVSLCLNHPEDSSILNILPVELKEAAASRAGQRLLLLSASDFSLTASISEFSFQRLKLQPGTRVFAQIKSVALVDFSGI